MNRFELAELTTLLTRLDPVRGQPPEFVSLSPVCETIAWKPGSGPTLRE